MIERYVKGGAEPARIESAEVASKDDSAMVTSQRTSAFASAFTAHLQAAAATEASEMASSHEHRSAVPTSQRTSAFRHRAHERDSETLRVHGFVRNTFAGSDHLQSQTKARRDELAALRRGILPENPTPPRLRLPPTARRAVRLYKAGHIRHPADLLTPSDVDGRDFGLAHLTCFVEMKQRGHVDHMRASRKHPPQRDPPRLCRHLYAQAPSLRVDSGQYVGSLSSAARQQHSTRLSPLSCEVHALVL